MYGNFPYYKGSAVSDLKIVRNRLNTHLGTSLDDFLQEDGIHEEVSAAAMKRVIAWQIAQAMLNRFYQRCRPNTCNCASRRATSSAVPLAATRSSPHWAFS